MRRRRLSKYLGDGTMPLIGVAALLLTLVVIGMVFLVPSPAASPTTQPEDKRAGALQTYEYSATILFMGDTMLGRTVGPAIIAGDNPYKYVSAILSSYDLRIANIESVVADPAIATTPQPKRYTFNAPLAGLQTLKAQSIDVNVLANNHTGDYGPAAMANTIDNFDTAGLRHVGAGRTVAEAFAPLIVDVPMHATANAPKATVRLAFIAFNDFENVYSDVSSSRTGSAYFNKEELQKSIASAREQGARLIFAVPHWGTEFQLNQHNARQQMIGHWLIDNGVDAVVGGHPHVIQPTEYYQGKPIVYSMGNFIFSGMESIANTSRGQMIGFTLSATIKSTSSADSIATSPSLGKPIYHLYNLDLNGYPVPEVTKDD